MASNSALYSLEKGLLALRLYRRVMKLHMTNMPQDLRLIGDLYVKQEFRLHLDKATPDQMDKFLTGWEGYAKQIERVDHKKGPKHVKQQLTQDAEVVDSVIKEKFNQEQMASLNDFKNLIYETEQKKKDGPPAAVKSEGGCGSPGCGTKGPGGCH